MSGATLDKPVLFVTGHAPFDRVGAFTRLHEREGVEYALFGGRMRHGGHAMGGPASGPALEPTHGPSPQPELPFPHRHVRQHELAGIAASGRHRAVVVSTGGRVALPGAWAGARRAGVPLILWSALWAHPRTPAHAFSWLALRRLYRTADAIVAYGPHVAAYVRARGAHNVHVAPQAVDNEFWSRPPSRQPPRSPSSRQPPEPLSRHPPEPPSRPTAPNRHPPFVPGWPSETAVKFLFAGRPLREKGVGVLMRAWTHSDLLAPSAALVLVGVGSTPPRIPAGGAVCLDPVPPAQLRDMYAAADVLVVPSIATRTFREPWGLVVNEAMNHNLPVIATDAVGAVAGGLVRDGHNGVVVPAGDARALAAAMRRLAADAALRERLGEAGGRDVRAYTYDAWAEGFSKALASLGLSRAGASAPTSAGAGAGGSAGGEGGTRRRGGTGDTEEIVRRTSRWRRW